MTAPSRISAQVFPARTGVDRATLVRRTYGLVFGTIIITMIGTASAMSVPSLMQFAVEHPFLGFFVGFFAPLFLAQLWHKDIARSLPLTLLATFVEGVMIAPFLAFAELRAPGTVSQAAVLTLAVFGGLTAYAAVSRRDFSAWGGFFFVGLIALLVVGVLNIFFQNENVSLWIAGATVFVFGGLLVFDTWRILRTDAYGPGDFVLAAIQIYLDLLNIFLSIVRLLGGRRN